LGQSRRYCHVRSLVRYPRYRSYPPVRSPPSYIRSANNGTENGGYRRDHLRALTQRVEVDTKEVRIMGAKSALLRTLVAASSAETAGFGVSSWYRSGAPRSMNMGTIASPCRYDAGA
jgi:hypothetical protein